MNAENELMWKLSNSAGVLDAHPYYILKFLRHNNYVMPVTYSLLDNEPFMYYCHMPFDLITPTGTRINLLKQDWAYVRGELYQNIKQEYHV